MNRWTRSLIMVLAVVMLVEVTIGQGWRRGPTISRDRNGVPTWDTHPTMPKDVFTLVRLEFDSSGRCQWGRGGGWRVDWPEADLNFSYRLEEMTALKTNPDPIYLRLTDPAIFDYQFVYMIEPGSLNLSRPGFYLPVLAMVAMVCSLLFYTGYRLGGNATDSVVQAAVTTPDWRSDLEKQQQAIEQTRRTSQAHLDALALRVAQIQDQFMRLDGLGQRLVDLPDLDEGELNF